MDSTSEKSDMVSMELVDFINLPQTKLIETPGLHGISQLTAMKIDPVTNQPLGDFQFKIMFSPNRSVIRMELYDPNVFAILLEQIMEKGYRVISSGEDVEFTHGNKGGWLGWAHLIKTE